MENDVEMQNVNVNIKSEFLDGNNTEEVKEEEEVKENDGEKKEEDDDGGEEDKDGTAEEEAIMTDEEEKKKTMGQKVKSTGEFGLLVVKFSYSKFVNIFDSYGEGILGPKSRKKTLVGAILSIIFKIIMVVLLLYFTINLFLGRRQIQSEGQSVLNYLHYTDQDKKLFDIPSIAFYLDSEMTFFENRSASSVHKIEVIDTLGYDKTLSTKDETVPITKSFYKRLVVPINSAASKTVDSHSTYSYNSLAGTGTADDNLESPDFPSIIDVIKFENHLFDTVDEFYPHTAHLFVRFDTDELASIKPCQLQVALVNEGVYENLNTFNSYGWNSSEELHFDDKKEDWVRYFYFEDEYDLMGELVEDAAELRSLPAANVKLFNVLHLKQEFSQETFDNMTNAMDEGDYEVVDFVDWRYMINYVNNFRFVQLPSECPGFRPSFLDEVTLTTVVTWPGAEYVFIHVDTQGADYGDVEEEMYEMNYPKYVYFSYGEQFEYVKVTELVNFPSEYFPYIVFKTDQTGTKDFTNLPGIDTDYATTFKRFVTQQGVPTVNATHPSSNWTCTTDYYTDSYCDCDCGSADPYCDLLRDRVFSDVSMSVGDMYTTCDYFFPLCPNWGEPTCFAPPVMNSVSSFCDDVPPSNEVFESFVGFLGDTEVIESTCSACPSDVNFRLEDQETEILCHREIVGRFVDKDPWESCFISPDDGKEVCCYPGVVELEQNMIFPNATDPPWKMNVAILDKTANVLLVANPEMFDGLTVQGVCLADSSRYVNRGYVLGNIAWYRTRIFVVDAYEPYSIEDNVNRTFRIGDENQLNSFEVQVSSITKGKSSDGMDAFPEFYVFELSEFPEFSHGRFARIMNIDPSRTILNLTEGLIWDNEEFYALLTKSNGFVQTCEILDFVDHGSFSILQCFDPLEDIFEAGDTVEMKEEEYFIFQGDVIGKYYQKAEFSPPDYHSQSPASPTELNVEAYLLVIPDDSRTEDEDLCPTVEIEVNNTYSMKARPNNYESLWKEWTIIDRKRHAVECEEVEDYTDTCLDVRESGEEDCINEMKPQRVFNYEHRIPINHKFNFHGTDEETAGNLKNIPEFNFKYQHVYHFQHDEFVESVDKEFEDTLKVMVNQRGEEVLYSGSREFIGIPSYGKELYPANYPKVSIGIEVDLDPLFDDDFRQMIDDNNGLFARMFTNPESWLGSWKGKSGTPSEYVRNVKEFEPLECDFSSEHSSAGNNDHSRLEVMIKPGIKYTVKIEVTATPKYRRGQLRISDWNGVQLEQSYSFISQSALEYQDRQKCVIEYQLTVAGGLREFHAVKYTLFDWLSSIGSVFGLVGIGLVMLGLWQSCKCLKPKDLLDFNQFKEEERKAKKEKKELEALKIAQKSLSAEFKRKTLFNVGSVDVVEEDIVVSESDNVRENLELEDDVFRNTTTEEEFSESGEESGSGSSEKEEVDN